MRKAEVTLTVTWTTKDHNVSQCGQTLSRISESVEHSIDSLRQVNLHQSCTEVTETMKSHVHGDSTVWTREGSKHSPDSRKELTTGSTEAKAWSQQQEGLQNGPLLAACGGDSGKPLTHLTKCVTCINNIGSKVPSFHG